MKAIPLKTIRFGAQILMLALIVGCTGLVQSQSSHEYLPALRSEDPEVRKKALKDLGIFLVDPPDVPRLDSDETKRGMVVDSLIELSSDPDPEIREGAIGCLSHVGYTRAIEPMAKALKDENSKVRATAAASFFLLMEIRDRPDIIGQLEVLIDDPDENVRAGAAQSLMTCGTEDSLVVMRRRLTEEKNPKVKANLEVAIEEIQKRTIEK